MSLRVLNKSCVMYILLMSFWNKVVGALSTNGYITLTVKGGYFSKNTIV